MNIKKIVILLYISYKMTGCSDPTMLSTIDPKIKNISLNSLCLLPINNTAISKEENSKIIKLFSNGFKIKNPAIKLLKNEELSAKLINYKIQNNVKHIFEGPIANRTFNISVAKQVLDSLNVDGILYLELEDVQRRTGSFMAKQPGTTKLTINTYLISSQSTNILWKSEVMVSKRNKVVITPGKNYYDDDIKSAPPLMDVLEIGLNKVIRTIPTL